VTTTRGNRGGEREREERRERKKKRKGKRRVGNWGKGDVVVLKEQTICLESGSRRHLQIVPRLGS
jgi:hypothetical protein